MIRALTVFTLIEIMHMNLLNVQKQLVFIGFTITEIIMQNVIEPGGK